MFHRRVSTICVRATLALVLCAAFASSALAQETTGQFTGNRVNKGSVVFEVRGGQRTLSLSNDFEKPGSPDPHWQVIDSKGRTFLLQRLEAKDGKFNSTIVLPDYIEDVAKVQMWCAFAEVVLGEASFAKPVR